MENLKFLIAGEITMSDDPGGTMKKWREIFNITQSELASYLNLSPSTISDYESGRRRSPGVSVIRRFVNAIVAIDLERGGQILERLKSQWERKEGDSYYQVVDFAKAITAEELVEMLEGEVVTNKEKLKDIHLYGATIIDSIKAILEMRWDTFPYLYGGIGERAFVFLEVSTGRSPLVVIRIAPIKPKVVVLHGISKVDPLAVKISEREGIPIITTRMDVASLKKKLLKLATL